MYSLVHIPTCVVFCGMLSHSGFFSLHCYSVRVCGLGRDGGTTHRNPVVVRWGHILAPYLGGFILLLSCNYRLCAADNL